MVHRRQHHRNTGSKALANVERLLMHIIANQGRIMRALRIMHEFEHGKDLEAMAKWDSMVATVAKVRGAQESNKRFVEELLKKVDELAAGMSDEEDQRKVEEFSSELSAIADQIPQATVTNPGPGEVIPSAGGVGGSGAGPQTGEISGGGV